MTEKSGRIRRCPPTKWSALTRTEILQAFLDGMEPLRRVIFDQRLGLVDGAILTADQALRLERILHDISDLGDEVDAAGRT